MVSLLIPVFNERNALPDLADQVRSACAGLSMSWEAIFVDDGSDDGSTEVLRGIVADSPHFMLVRLRRNFGKSVALMAGFATARGERIVTLDSDLQDDPAEVPRLLDKLNQGYDLVSGWKQRRCDSLPKRSTSRVFNWVTAKMSGVRLHDFNCGLKAYRADVARDLVLYGELYRYIPVICAQRGWRVCELPVSHRPRRHGVSKFGSERYLRGLFDLFTVLFMGRYQSRPLHLFGGLGLALMSVGLVFCAYLTALKIQGEAIGRRPLLLLGVLLIVVGVQLLSLGLIGEMIAASRESQTKEEAQRNKIEEVVSGVEAMEVVNQ